MSSEPQIRKVRVDELEEAWRVHVASSIDFALPLHPWCIGAHDG